MADETNKDPKKIDTSPPEERPTPTFSQPSFGLEPEHSSPEDSESARADLDERAVDDEPEETVTPVVDEPAADPSVPEGLARASELEEPHPEASAPEQEDVGSLRTPEPVVVSYKEPQSSEPTVPEKQEHVSAETMVPEFTLGSAAEAPRAHVDGIAAYFDYPGEFLEAAAAVRDDEFKNWDAFSPFPVHGIEDAMGIGRSWLPWVTFAAGLTGLVTANLLQFGTLTFDWPMIIGGKPYAPWPSFVPIMFELTVLIGGVTTALVMLIAAGCFRKPRIIDPEITKDRFVIWIDAKDPSFHRARGFLQGLDPVEIRDVTFEA